MAKATETERVIPPFEECPRFSKCSVNVCPLDPEQDRRTHLDGDPKCGLGKTYRMRVAARYPQLLPRRGLFPRELASLLVWERLTPEEREVRRERLRRQLADAGNPL